jgi:chromosome segregation ATPase
MAIENKEELIKKIAVLESENLKLRQRETEFDNTKKEILSVKKSSEEITANEHSVRSSLEKSLAENVSIKKTIEARDKQIEVLKADLTKLATLFDEYIVAYQDQVKMLGVFVKNTQTIEKYLSEKINEFNGGDKK